MVRKKKSDFSVKEYLIIGEDKVENIKKVFEDFEQFKPLNWKFNKYDSTHNEDFKDLETQEDEFEDNFNITVKEALEASKIGDVNQFIESIKEDNEVKPKEDTKVEETSVQAYSLVVMGGTELVERAHVYIDAFAKEQILPERVKSEPKKRRGIFGRSK